MTGQVLLQLFYGRPGLPGWAGTRKRPKFSSIYTHPKWNPGYATGVHVYLVMLITWILMVDEPGLQQHKVLLDRIAVLRT